MAKNKQLIIPLSFKQSEIELYNTIKQKSGYSNWIKDIIKEHLNNNKTKNDIENPFVIMNTPVFKEWE